MAMTLLPNAQSEGMVDLGTYSFSGVASISLPTNTFSTAYDNYLIQMNYKNTTTAGSMYLRLRSSGTDISASYYFGAQGWSSAGAAINRATVNGAEFNLNGAANAKADDAFYNSINIKLFNPLTTARKSVWCEHTYWNASDVQNSMQGGGFTSSSSIADSASFLITGGTITGSVYVYGMRK